MTALQGNNVASTAPTDGYVLTWNDTGSQWEPQAAGGGSTPVWDDVYDATSGSYLNIDNNDKPFWVRQMTSASQQGAALRVTRDYETGGSNPDDSAVFFETTTGGYGYGPTLTVSHQKRGLNDSSIDGFAMEILVGDYDKTSFLKIERTSGTSDPNRYMIQTKDVGTSRFYTRQNGATRIITSSDTWNDPALYINHNDDAQAAVRVVQGSGSGDILWLQDNTTDRFVLSKAGTVVQTVNGGTGLTINQTGTGALLSLQDSATSRFSVSEGGLASINTLSTLASEALSITQNDTEQAFINFAGTEASDQVASITDVQGDGSNVVGPLDKTTSVGWAFAKMVKIEINGTAYYIAAYSVAA